MPTHLPPDAAKRLKWPLRLTRLGMLSEALLRAFWPVLVVAMLAAAALASGGIAALAWQFGVGALGVLAAAALVFLALGLWKLRLPSRAEATQRLDATLPGQPIALLEDDQAIGAQDAASRAVWQTHRDRMAQRLKAARARAPDLRLSARDPYALRYAALLALVMALTYGVAFKTSDIGEMLPHTSTEAAIISAWEGWIEPPAYTGKPTLYLGDQPTGDLAVPVGSRMILRFYGKLGDLTLRETVSGQAASENGAQYRFDVVQDGVLAIEGPKAARWNITATPDAAPRIAVFGDLTRTLAGELQQGFQASDDYGVASGQAVMVLDLAAVKRDFGLTIAPEPRAAIEVSLPIPFRGDRSDFDAVMVENFAEHAWADMPVSLVFGVEDEAGQVGESAPVTLTLPGRRFLNPLAMALIEQRRDILWNRENAPRVARILRAISNRPDGFFSRETTYLILRTLARRLEDGAGDGAVDGVSSVARDEVAQGLWDIATSIEDASLEDALERLRRAQERLSEAMEQGASEEELAELMDELRQAMRDYTNQLAQNPPPDGDASQAELADMPTLSQEDLEAMMDEIEKAMKEGRQQEAQAMLDQLQEMMENMRSAEAQPGQGGSPGDQAMQGLSDSLNQQQGLSDEAFRDLQEQQGNGQMAGENQGNVGRDGGQGKGQSHSGEGGDGQGEGADGDPGSDPGGDLAERQRQLAESLGDQRRNLPGAGSQSGDAAREALAEAERAMRGAAEGLAEGDTSGALDRQAEAMEALREGMRQLDQAMAEAERNREGQQGSNDGQSGSQRANDPLGRGPNNRGGLADDAPLEGGADVYRRAQELMDDIRRRAGEGERPEVERDYLRRLLDRF